MELLLLLASVDVPPAVVELRERMYRKEKDLQNEVEDEEYYKKRLFCRAGSSRRSVYICEGVNVGGANVYNILSLLVSANDSTRPSPHYLHVSLSLILIYYHHLL